MNRTTWRRVEALVDAAAGLDEAARERFLDAECRDDEALRHEAKRILDALDAGGDFLDRASWAPHKALDEVAAVGDQDGGQRLIGERVGRYVVERFLGRGGMGSVYRAKRADGQFRRSVALKVLRHDLSGDEPLRRFLTERQILAGLSHPHIADLLDGGTTDDGRPFLVMELIEGEAIHAYCQRRSLSVEDRLALFLKVCDAVHYAHQHLIVHRDLKPSNILVTADGTPKLLDFGIAKLLDTHALDVTVHTTRTGVRPLTPGYASPEQIRGEPVTTASDVYALGVLLFRLLTGRGPYRLEHGLAHELESAILEQEVERPSDAVDPSQQALKQRLRGDLDTVVLVALRKQPERRYGSVLALAEDIRRHLASRPVSARPDTLRYRTSKLVRRHPLAMLAGCTALIAIVAFALFASWQSAEIAQQRDLARQKSTRQEQVSDFLIRLFEDADPRLDADATQLRVRDVLDRARRQIDQLDGVPDVQATYLQTMGQTYRSLGLYDEAGTLLRRSLAIQRQIHGAQHLEIAEGLYELATVHQLQGDYRPAETLLAESLAMHRRFLGDEHPEVAACLNELGLVAYEQGKLETAEGHFREALSMTEDEPVLATADSVHNLALVAHDRGTFDAAEALYRRGLAMTRSIFGNHHADVATSLNSLAVLLHDKEDFDAAEAMHREALTMRRRLFGDRHPAVVASLTNLAQLLQDKGDAEAAVPLFDEAVTSSREVLGPDHPHVAALLNNFALLKHDKVDLAAAEAMFRESMRIRTQVFGAGHSSLSVVIANLASVLKDRHDLDGAEALLQQALALDLESLGEDHPEIGFALHDLGVVRFFQGDIEAAERLIQRAYDVRLRHLGEEHSRVALTAVSLARLDLARDRPEAAEARLAAAMPVLRQKLKPDNRDLPYAELVLAASQSVRDPQAGEDRFATWLPHLERAIDPRAPALRDAWILFADHHQRRGDLDAATRARERAAASTPRGEGNNS